MKKLMLAMVMAMAALVMAGCGDGKKADESKSPETIKQEVAKMDAADIQKTVANYQAAIEKKTAELNKKADELKQIPLTEMMGDKAKKIQGDMAEITKSIDKLKTNMAAYAEGLKK